MSLLRFKNGVKVSQQAIIAAAAHNAREVSGITGDTWVTSGNDSVHMQDSKHYSNEALDLRVWGLSKTTQEQWAASIRERLGRNYDVIVEKDHIHVEYDPKK